MIALGIWLLVLISALNLITNFQMYRMKKKEMYDTKWKVDMAKEFDYKFTTRDGEADVREYLKNRKEEHLKNKDK